MKIFDEFKAFAMRGNVVDMAVGIIIGGAFGKIIASLVSDVLMPPLGLLLGGIDFKDMIYVLKEAVVQGEEILVPAVTINYGLFIQNIVDFLIIAFAIFMVIRGMNKMKRKEEKDVEVAAPPAPTKEEELLAEIRDLLKK